MCDFWMAILDNIVCFYVACVFLIWMINPEKKKANIAKLNIKMTNVEKTPQVTRNIVIMLPVLYIQIYLKLLVAILIDTNKDVSSKHLRLPITEH